MFIQKNEELAKIYLWINFKKQAKNMTSVARAKIVFSGEHPIGLKAVLYDTALELSKLPIQFLL